MQQVLKNKNKNLKNYKKQTNMKKYKTKKYIKNVT